MKEKTRKNKAVLLDRDGVIVEDIGYHHKLEDLRIVPNAVKGLKLLKYYKLIVVTNQSGIGRGYYGFEDYEKFNGYMLKELKKHNIKIEKIYVCPHHPNENCKCRKPEPKLIKDAARHFDIDLANSFMIGDRERDIEMGHNAGCKSVLVLTGNGMKEKEHSKADYFAKDLLDAARWILKND